MRPTELRPLALGHPFLISGPGVVPVGKKFSAQVSVKGQTLHLGRFDCPIKAALAYDQ